MSNKADFQQYYLRQIGVSTPLSQSDANHRQEEGAQAPSSAVSGTLDASVCVQATVGAEVAESASPHLTGGEALPGNLADLRAAAASCRACGLSEQRRQVVFGQGSEQPEVLFIGEAPGEQEDAQGEPFVGPAGQLLNRMLGSVHWSREQVYIMNIIKCRPPRNRDPKPEEIQACSRWFDAQWDVLQPRLVCLLGRVAAQRVLGSDAPLSALRGHWHEYRGVPVLVSYHPSYLLRSPVSKATAWQDFRNLAERSRMIKS
ncbi:MAG: uracil-DNA glycosylase [Mariprofundaceae bacterium]|nr:uracil-DNA glycosylase [Mariprofundaceae bacterium]